MLNKMNATLVTIKYFGSVFFVIKLIGKIQNEIKRFFKSKKQNREKSLRM